MIEELRMQAGGRVAILVGNGINQYPNGGQSWSGLLEKLVRDNDFPEPEKAKKLALPELYDLIELRRPAASGPLSAKQAFPLKRQFCNGMEGWKPASHQIAIVSWAKKHNSPILTTNFDEVLAAAANAKKRSLFKPRGSRRRASDYYPWEKYFAEVPLARPSDGFGIWHINGLISHTRSIRLGLSDYMGCVTRCRPWLMRVDDFSTWAGEDTWLDIVFRMPLVIFGLGLDAQEVWLRWLLIQRARHYKKRIDERPRAWYVHTSKEQSDADREKHFFLKCLGVEPVEVPDYHAIYHPNHWS